MLLAAFGEKPQEMGGYRTHNPVRLWIRSVFREALKRHADAELLISLDLGVGQWCAEVAVEENRVFQAVTHDQPPESWNTAQKTKHEELLRAAAYQHFFNAQSNAERALSSLLLDTSRKGQDIYVLAALPEGRTASRVAQAIEYIAKGITPRTKILVLHPEHLPVQWQALGLIEEIRGAIPQGLEDKLEKTAQQLSDLIVSGSVTDSSIVKKLSKRAHEMRSMKKYIDALMARGG